MIFSGECDITLLTDSNRLHVDSKTQIKFLRDADVVLKVGDCYYLAHKNILSEKNDALKEMINSASLDSFSTSINFPDVDEDTFESFLRYMYTDKVGGNYFSEELLKLAHKYSHKMLKNHCEDHLRGNLHFDNVIDVLIMAIKFELERLRTNALNLIVVRYDKIEKLDSYQQLLRNPEAMDAVVKTFKRLQLTDTSKI